MKNIRSARLLTCGEERLVERVAALASRHVQWAVSPSVDIASKLVLLSALEVGKAVRI